MSAIVASKRCVPLVVAEVSEGKYFAREVLYSVKNVGTIASTKWLFIIVIHAL